MSEQKTFRLVTKDDALVARVVHDIERMVKQEQHEHAAGPHAVTYKVVPPLTHEARGFTRTVYLHTKTEEAAALARSEIADIGAMTCKEG
jgi:hypothetical protein